MYWNRRRRAFGYSDEVQNRYCETVKRNVNRACLENRQTDG